MSEHIVVMGVSGCGKSTVAAGLAHALGGTYIDGDDLHPRANIEKMSAGQPLTDDDRWPWLRDVGKTLAQGRPPRVIACSALKRSYRERIAEAADVPVLFVHLHGADEVLLDRMGKREGHFMPPDLLDSQLATLEMPGADEPVVTLDIDQLPEDLIAAAVAAVEGRA